jgi:hypothetical protein
VVGWELLFFCLDPSLITLFWASKASFNLVISSVLPSRIDESTRSVVLRVEETAIPSSSTTMFRAFGVMVAASDSFSFSWPSLSVLSPSGSSVSCSLLS